MCGRSFVARKPGFARRSHGPFGLDAGEMGPGAQVLAALVVLIPVALSGVILAFTQVWWIFTTYFWVAFPAFGLLARGVASMSEAGPGRFTETRERELLRALRDHGELTPARAAMETSLSVAEADRMLEKLAEGGYLEVRVRGGGLAYGLWERAMIEESAG